MRKEIDERVCPLDLMEECANKVELTKIIKLNAKGKDLWFIPEGNTVIKVKLKPITTVEQAEKMWELMKDCCSSIYPELPDNCTLEDREMWTEAGRLSYILSDDTDVWFDLLKEESKIEFIKNCFGKETTPAERLEFWKNKVKEQETKPTVKMRRM